MTILFDGKFGPTDYWQDKNHWIGSFGTLSNCCLIRPDSLTVVTPPGRPGYAGKFTLIPGDVCNTNPNGDRAMLGYMPHYVYDGDDGWYSISSYLPTASIPDTWLMFYQIEMLWTERAGYPSIALYYEQGHWSLRWDENNVVNLGPFITDQWIDWIVHVKWSISNTGSIEVFNNKTLIFSKYNIRTIPLKIDGSPISKFEVDIGGYRSDSHITSSIYLTNLKIGTTRADVEYIEAITPAATYDLIITGDPSSGLQYVIELVTDDTRPIKVSFNVDGILYRSESVPRYCMFGGDTVCSSGKLTTDGQHTIRAVTTLQSTGEVLSDITRKIYQGVPTPTPTPAPIPLSASLVLIGVPESGQPYAIELITTATEQVKVDFYVDNVLYRSEVTPRYCLFGGDTCAPSRLAGDGQHNITAIVYSISTGSILTSTSTFITQGPVPTPTPTPAPTPTPTPTPAPTFSITVEGVPAGAQIMSDPVTLMRVRRENIISKLVRQMRATRERRR